LCAKSAASLLVAAWLAFQLGGASPSSRALDQLERAVTRPLPAVPQREVTPPDRVWVPDRYIPGPDGGVAHVPAHWERRVTDREFHVPPLVVCGAGRECVLVPAGVRPPAAERQGP
jgi:hypothetical protein